MIGRDAACDLVVPHGSVSRRHARLEPRAGGWAVVDQASANGTFVDNQRVADVGLRDGHVVRFGAVSFRVELEDAAHDGQATVTEAAAIPEHLIPESARHIGLPEAPARAPAAAAPVRPSAPPPPPARAAAPPRAGAAPEAAGGRRGLLFWVGGGCLGCLTIALLGLLVAGGSLYYLTQPPVNAVLEQLSALQAGHIDPVYEALDDTYRERVSRDEFVGFVARHPALREYRDASLANWSLDSRKVSITGTLRATSGEEEVATFELVQRSGVWRITAIEVENDEAP
jgi:hypothetical protein